MQEIYEAIAKVQQELGHTILPDAEGQFGHYVSLETVLKTIYPLAAKHGLLIIQRPLVIDGRPILETIIRHPASDDAVDCYYLLTPDKPGPQSLGASETYARRRSLMTMFGLATENDPDAIQKGHKASQPSMPSAGYSRSKESTSGALSREKTQFVGTNSLYDHIVPFGKFKGKRVGDCSLDELLSYCAWMEKKAKQDGKPLSHAANELYDVVIALKQDIENSTTPGESFARASDDIPF